MLRALLPNYRAFLREAGYEILSRSNGWAECLVERAGERWEGRGRDVEDAFSDALRKMFPSQVARELLQSRVGAGIGEDSRGAQAPSASGNSGAVETTPPAVTAEQSSHLQQAEQPARRATTTLPSMGTESPLDAPERPEATTEPASSTPSSALPESAERVRSPESAALEAAAAPSSADDVAAKQAPDAPPPRRTAITLMNLPTAASARASVEAEHGEERRSRAKVVEVVGAVERLVSEIEERLGRVARMSPEFQRLHIMVWICRARALEEAAPGARDAEQAVARVARRLTEIGKLLWPGSVRALQLSARPPDVRRELHATNSPEPSTWRDAKSLAERLLGEHAAKCAELGFDEDGWADGAMRSPPPKEPDALLEAVDAEIQSLLAGFEAGTARPADLSAADFEKLTTLARKLRWLRGAVNRDVAWGAAVGRLRRLSPSFGDRGSRVRDALDPRTKPSSSWAKVLGAVTQEPSAPAGEDAEALKAELATARETPASFVAWIIRALDVLNTPDLVALMVPLKGELTSLGDETLNHSDRRVRRRVRELVRRVTSAADAPVETPAREEVAPPDEEVASEENIGSRVLDELATRVRARTAGKRVLFVSNREDPDLGAKLSELLGVEITWCDGSLRRVQAQCERVKGGAYDLVLSATGFQVHGVDAAVSRAASAGDVPYVRVNRGRPVACVQAIAREFGIAAAALRASSDD